MCCKAVEMKHIETKILVVDDEKDLCEVIKISLSRLHIQTITVHTVKDAIEQLKETDYQGILTDLNLNQAQNGLNLVKHVNTYHSNIPIAVMSAYGDSEVALNSLKMGAFDFIDKPIGFDKLKMLVDKMLETYRLKNNIIEQHDPTDKLLGISPSIIFLKNYLKKIAQGQAPVFIQGESGVGKEVVATVIHNASGRANAPFIAINCGAIPNELIESELFGHKKGSFSGATMDRVGLIEMANGGTLFLDEIADLPQNMQVKLLRVLQEKKIRPVGSNEEILVDFRLISATHQCLQSLVKNGKFREDLFFRLNVLEVFVPPLRERSQDIEILASYFLKQICENHGVNIKKLTPAALDWLTQQPFKGNIRQLINMLEKAVSVSYGNEICIKDFGEMPILSSNTNNAAMLSDTIPQGFDLDKHLSCYENEWVHKALKQTGGNQTEAAKLLNISLRSLRYRMLEKQ